MPYVGSDGVTAPLPETITKHWPATPTNHPQPSSSLRHQSRVARSNADYAAREAGLLRTDSGSNKATYNSVGAQPDPRHQVPYRSSSTQTDTRIGATSRSVGTQTDLRNNAMYRSRGTQMNSHIASPVNGNGVNSRAAPASSSNSSGASAPLYQNVSSARAASGAGRGFPTGQLANPAAPPGSGAAPLGSRAAPPGHRATPPPGHGTGGRGTHPGLVNGQAPQPGHGGPRTLPPGLMRPPGPQGPQNLQQSPLGSVHLPPSQLGHVAFPDTVNRYNFNQQPAPIQPGQGQPLHPGFSHHPQATQQGQQPPPYQEETVHNPGGVYNIRHYNGPVRFYNSTIRSQCNNLGQGCGGVHNVLQDLGGIPEGHNHATQ